MSTHGLLQMAVYIVGGLDHRFGWTSGLPIGAQLAALVACFLGYAVTVWATACTPFFSLIVRIQTDRGHTVATGGPYRLCATRPISEPCCLGSRLACCWDRGGPS